MKQIKDITTAEWRKAWTEIAIAFETERKYRTFAQQNITIDGLCLAWREHVGLNVYGIGASLKLLYPGNAFGYWFPPFCLPDSWTREYDLLRATFAAMFASMTPKEFLEICEAPRG